MSKQTTAISPADQAALAADMRALRTPPALSTTPTAITDAQALALHLSGTVALAIGDAIEGRKTVADVMAAVAQYGAAMRHLGDVSGAA